MTSNFDGIFPILAPILEAKKILEVRMVKLFCSPSALLEPSWRQVAIFIDFRRVLASVLEAKIEKNAVKIRCHF